MAARKLQQEVEKCFKKVTEGIADFDEIYDKIDQSNNQTQKEKLEDNLKREIKKLQRMRDQIKTWTQSNDIKDKTALMDNRRLIESRMEQFKAVEKLMKTKAFSKEGLSAQATLDPREKAKIESSDWLGTQIEALEQQIEQFEADRETLSTVKKGKKSKENASRMAELDTMIEKHKYHQGKIEQIRRALVNDSVDPEQVNALKDGLEYYINEGQSADYYEDDALYDDLALEEEDEAFGLAQDDKVSSQDTQSIQGDTLEAPEVRSSSAVSRGKERASVDAPTTTTTRKSASQLKSPLTTLATLHTPPLTTIGNGPAANPAGMKPAAVPTRPPGEGLKYASAAAAAADKNNVGIAPLPPPPSANPAVSAAASQSKPSSTSSPSLSSAQLATSSQAAEPRPAPLAAPPARSASSSAPTPASSTPKPELLKPTVSRAAAKTAAALAAPSVPHTNGVSNGVKAAEPVEDESIYHLPSSLGDLMECWEVTKTNAKPPTNPSTQRMVAISRENCPDVLDAEPLKTQRPEFYWDTSITWPKEQLTLIDNAALYSPSKMENDTLFYAFYYKQGSYQQYLAARALKDQAWRFHKQYQTWFQRHEEPKNITEEFEQGTYRFFDYESTWMNRRKADFKFAYKFLEDEV